VPLLAPSTPRQTVPDGVGQLEGMDDYRLLMDLQRSDIGVLIRFIFGYVPLWYPKDIYENIFPHRAYSLIHTNRCSALLPICYNYKEAPSYAFINFENTAKSPTTSVHPCCSELLSQSRVRNFQSAREKDNPTEEIDTGRRAWHRQDVPH
jgi:hypothetical protein